MDEETEAQRGWLEYFPRVRRLSISDFALGTAGSGVGWGGGRWGEPAQRGQHDGHRPPWVLGGAVARTVCLIFGLRVIEFGPLRWQICACDWGGGCPVYVCSCLESPGVG